MAHKDWKRVKTNQIMRWDGVGDNSNNALIVGQSNFKGKTFFVVDLDRDGDINQLKKSLTKTRAIAWANSYMGRH